jgi:hypothetical protein
VDDARVGNGLAGRAEAVGGERSEHGFEDADVTPDQLKEIQGFLCLDGTVWVGGCAAGGTGGGRGDRRW